MAKPPVQSKETGNPNIGLAAFYNMVQGRRGFTLAPHHYPLVAALEDKRIVNLLILIAAGAGKALAPDTPILTSKGWKVMYDVTPGDQVMHPSGFFTQVVGRSETPIDQLWRVNLSDGRSLVAHDNHLWSVHHQRVGVKSINAGRRENGKQTTISVRHTPVKDAWETMSTADLRSLMDRQPSLRCYLPLTDPVELPPVPVWSGDTHVSKGHYVKDVSMPGFDPRTQMAMPPYLLGCILGDGYVNSVGISLVSSDDDEMAEHMQADAAAVGMSIRRSGLASKVHCATWRIEGAATRMAALGLAGKKADSKFIPLIYFHGSVAQRLALLQGLMDTNGTVGKNSNTTFTSISYRLAHGVQQLVWSLGGSARITVHSKTYPYRGEKRVGKPAYRVSIRMRDPRQILRLARKRDLAYPTQYADTLKLRIESVEAAHRDLSVCIQVEAEDGLFLAGDYVVTHNSNLLDIIYPCWELGRDPTTAILSVSAGERLPQTFMQASMQIIRDDPTFRATFPNVKPDTSVGWSLERGLFVTGHHGGDENPTYFAAGLGSKALTGLHARILIFDDLHDEENARTSESRAEVISRYYRTLLDRSDPRGCRKVAVGRWWAPDDLYQEWRRSGDWVVMELPATRNPKTGGSVRLWYDVYVPHGTECCFTETAELAPDQDPDSEYVKYRVYYAALDKTGEGFYWPDSPTKRRNYKVVKRRQPRVAAINYDGDMSAGGEGIFSKDDFRVYMPPENLALGIQAPQVRGWARSLRGEVEEAWDTALGQPQSASMTVALTGLLVPCKEWHKGEDPDLVGPCDFHYDVYLLDIMVRDINFQELAMALRQRHGLWHPRRVIVEEKQSGVGLLQTFRGTHIPVFGQKVEQGKVERAVNPVLVAENGLPIGGGAASVQGWMKMGRVLVPAGCEWLTRGADGKEDSGFLNRVCSFRGGPRANDEFDALVHLVTRAIMLSRQTAYVPGMDGQGSSLPPIPEGWGAAMAGDPRAESLGAFMAMSAAGGEIVMSNPFQGLCGAPCHWYAVIGNAERCTHANHPAVINALHGCQDWLRHGSVTEDV